VIVRGGSTTRGRPRKDEEESGGGETGGETERGDSCGGGSGKAGGEAEGGGDSSVGGVEWGSGRDMSGRVMKEIDSAAVEEGLEEGRG